MVVLSTQGLPYLHNSLTCPASSVSPFFPGLAAIQGFRASLSQKQSKIAVIIVFYMRHRQAVEYYGHRLNWEHTGWRKVSLALMWVGILSTLGVTIVANFRVS